MLTLIVNNLFLANLPNLAYVFFSTFLEASLYHYRNHNLADPLTCLPPVYLIFDNTTWIPNTVNCIHTFSGLLTSHITVRLIAVAKGEGTSSMDICNAI